VGTPAVFIYPLKTGALYLDSIFNCYNKSLLNVFSGLSLFLDEKVIFLGFF
jgi:hypothetical protein